MNQSIDDAETALTVLESQAPSTDAVRAQEEVRSAIVIAKRFPRDEILAEKRIKDSCARFSFANIATYTYKKGGSAVSGPSIRLAEALVQRWGNANAGWQVLEEKNGQSLVEAYAHDLETNNRRSTRWTVRHEITAYGKIKKLTDPRDVYEHIASQATRRVRACILAIIPWEVQEAAVQACAEAIKKGESSLPLSERIKRMVHRFADVGVSKEMIEARLVHPIDVVTADQLVELYGIFNALKERQSKREDFFVLPENERPRAAAASVLEVEG